VSAAFLGQWPWLAFLTIFTLKLKATSCAAISNTEADMQVANSPIATNDESRSSQCTSAIASKAHIACRYRQDHFTALTSARLTMIRCLRASSAASSALVISRCAAF
jgi:hypothetical protein